MPVEDGYELLSKVRAIANERGAALTAVAVTAHAKVEDRARALAIGYQAHVPKPVDPAELVLMLASLVEHADQAHIKK
jgi:CheY-like chemotaxis protein